MSEVDTDVLERAAAESLTRPSDASFWDDRLFTTHGATLSWAERGDDILEESNYLMAEEAIRAAAGDDADEHVIDATIKHWLVGSLRQLFVQVRDDAGDFTPAWIEAVTIGVGLKEDYSVLNESDYSEREYAVYEANLAEAVNSVENDYDEDQNVAEITAYAHEYNYFESVEYSEVDWDDVKSGWVAAREAYYAERGSAVLNAQIEGQLPLPDAYDHFRRHCHGGMAEGELS